MLQNSATNRQRRKYQWTAEWPELEGWYKQLRVRSSSSWCDNLTKKKCHSDFQMAFKQRTFAEVFCKQSPESLTRVLFRLPFQGAKQNAENSRQSCMAYVRCVSEELNPTRGTGQWIQERYLPFSEFFMASINLHRISHIWIIRKLCKHSLSCNVKWWMTTILLNALWLTWGNDSSRINGRMNT